GRPGRRGHRQRGGAGRLRRRGAVTGGRRDGRAGDRHPAGGGQDPPAGARGDVRLVRADQRRGGGGALTIRGRAVVACDPARTPACHGRLEVPTADLVWGAAAVRRALVARGWGPERAPDGRWLDVCPACAAWVREALAPTEPCRRPRPPA